MVGLLSTTDLARAQSLSRRMDQSLPDLRAGHLMTRDVLTVCPGTPLSRVVQKIVDTRNKSFPVVDDDRVVGVVAREDVMLALRRANTGEKP